MEVTFSLYGRDAQALSVRVSTSSRQHVSLEVMQDTKGREWTSGILLLTTCEARALATTLNEAAAELLK